MLPSPCAGLLPTKSIPSRRRRWIGEAQVPGVWWFKVRNSLVVNERRGVLVPRPRTADSLLEPQMVRHKHTLLTHLGLERRSTEQAA